MPDDRRVARILVDIEYLEDVRDLRRVGKAAARRIRKLGAKAYWRGPSLGKRSLLWLYLSFSPFVVSLIIVAPLTWRLAETAIRSEWFRVIFGDRFADFRWMLGSITCPPLCSQADLLMYAVVGGLGLFLSLAFAVWLRRGLLNSLPN
jgi:hypothetical protein